MYPSSQSDACVYQALCPLLSVSRAAGDRTQSAVPTMHPWTPRAMAFCFRLLPFPSSLPRSYPPSPQLAQVPKGPASGHVPSP